VRVWLVATLTAAAGCHRSSDVAPATSDDAGAPPSEGGLPSWNACASGTVAPASSGGPSPAIAYTEVREACASRNPLRNAYFGELHLHTGNSFDAWTYDVLTRPADAYRFARGEELRLPPLGPDGKGTFPAKLDRPLDFAAVTDHSEALGEVSLCTTPGTEVYDSAICATYRTGSVLTILGIGVIPPARPARPSICEADGGACLAAAAPVWRSVQDAAEQAYDRSSACTFTSFVAYEYSLAPGGANVHRNVIFRNATVPGLPVSTYEAPRPIDLWNQLEQSCTAGKCGCDVLAIPHNSNLANGRIFTPEYPDATSDAARRAQAAQRARLEPLVEIFQHKGDSECLPGLSAAMGASDELCDFEKVGPQQPGVWKDCGDQPGIGGLAGGGCAAGPPSRE
jgi:hypothetical protein